MDRRAVRHAGTMTRWRSGAWHRRGRGAASVLALALVVACTQGRAPASSPLDDAAQAYLQLAAALTAQDARSASGDSASASASARPGTAPLSFDDIATRARAAAAALAALPAETNRARRDWLVAHLTAVGTRASLRAGVHLTLNDELSGLFGIASAPVPAAATALEETRAALAHRLPGTGSPAARLDAYEQEVLVPAEQIPRVFERALEECRTQTRRALSLPDAESVSVTYVRGEPWSAFSTYLGVGLSRIDVNLSFPLTVDRALELACHEGYPGHHVINLLRERRVKDGRPELQAVPLFSPESFASEAAATTAASLVFTDEERLAFERDVLYPLAGLAPALAEPHHAVARLVDALAPAIEDALVRHLSGTLGYVETLWALQEQALMHHPEATLAFVNEYRSAALAYTWAKAPPAGSAGENDRRADVWRRFEALLAGDYRAWLLRPAP